MEKLLKVKEVKEILGCGIHRAYDIINQEDFPKITIGQRYYIPQKALEEWIENYTRKKYKL